MSRFSPIVIRGYGMSSSVGKNFPQKIPLQTPAQSLSLGEGVLPVFPLAAEDEALLSKTEQPTIGLDKAAHIARLAAARALSKASPRGRTAVIVGSARGATGVLEKSLATFFSEGKVRPFTSPSTTSGSIASFAAQEVSSSTIIADSISMTCSSGLFALMTGAAYLSSGLVESALVGGAEAPLTAFTLAQMHALRIYSRQSAQEFPCRPCNGKANTFCLGEGGAFFLLESFVSTEDHNRPLLITGIGTAKEEHGTPTGVSSEGHAFFGAMAEALSSASLPPEEIDFIVLHAPGTRAGDSAELQAVYRLFPKGCPLVSPKWLIGHTLGASGMLNAFYACELLTGRAAFLPFPYECSLLSAQLSPLPLSPRRALINAAGFGGAAVSVVIEVQV